MVHGFDKGGGVYHVELLQVLLVSMQKEDGEEEGRGGRGKRGGEGGGGRRGRMEGEEGGGGGRGRREGEEEGGGGRGRREGERQNNTHSSPIAHTKPPHLLPIQMPVHLHKQIKAWLVFTGKAIMKVHQCVVTLCVFVQSREAISKEVEGGGRGRGCKVGAEGGGRGRV